jgi:hypothetical protein
MDESLFWSIFCDEGKFLLETGLPDGVFSNKKSRFGYIFGGLAKKNLGIFYDHLVHFTAIENILWPFGIFCGHSVYFSPFWYFVPRIIWQPRLAPSDPLVLEWANSKQIILKN